ncbi:MAG: hypothetical protein KGZ56_06410, partial [Dethiobacter sp.]|nr:hypothetical protein [Dethiobacter sp.]
VLCSVPASSSYFNKILQAAGRIIGFISFLCLEAQRKGMVILMREDELVGAEDELVGAKEKKGGGTSFKDYVLITLIALVAVMGINNYLDARAGSGAGGCGGCGVASGAAATLTNEELERIGLEFYAESSGDTEMVNVQARVQDFGCHQEIYIYKDGRRVMRIGYASGQLFRMS